MTVSDISVDAVKERLAHVRERIEVAGGDVDRVRVVAVTKTHGPDAVRAALAAGLVDVGENYAQEAAAKHDQMVAAGDAQPTWNFIGNVQRNKVRLLAPFVGVWQTVDRASLVDEIAKRAPGATVLVQVDLAGDAGATERSGCAWDDVDRLVEHAQERGLHVRGLMGVAPVGAPEDARPGFRRLAATAHRLHLPEVSMGMTGDLEVAVQEGATSIRVGSALFGARPVLRRS